MAAENNEGHYAVQLQNRPWEIAARDIESALRALMQGFHKTAGGIQVSQAGIVMGSFDILDFTGDLIASVTADPANGKITITLASFGSPVGLGAANADGSSPNVARADHVHKREVEVLDETIAVGTRRRLNFSGEIVTAVDNGAQDRVDVNLPGYDVPVSLDVTNTEGVSGDVARADHKHASGLTTRGDILGRTTTANSRIPGPPTNYNADGWPYILKGGMDLSRMADWGLPWEPEVVKTLVNNTTTDIMYLVGTVANGSAAIIKYIVYCDDNTDVQQETGLVFVSCIRTAAGVFTTQVVKEAKTAIASAGTLAVTFTITNDAGNNRVIVQVNANSSLTPTDLSVIMSLDDLSWTGLTFPFGL